MKEVTIKDAGIKLIELTNAKTGLMLDMDLTQLKASEITTSAETQTIKVKLGAISDTQRRENRPGNTVLMSEPSRSIQRTIIYIYLYTLI